MSKDGPLISIITLNWNTPEVTCEFLESSKRLNYTNYEILVCDMASTVDPTSLINSKGFPKTKVLRSNKNLGFAAGNNFGIRQAKGDFIFIVNNDTELTPDLLDVLIAPFEKDPSIGVVCPKIRYFHDKETIQYAGYNPMNLYTGRTSSVGSKEKDHGQHDQSGYTNGAHGCAMMVKREVIEKTGMFPESFFLYYEEWDWSARILKGGYKIYYEAKGLIFHKESVTVGKQSPLKMYYHTRNRILYMRRNTKPGQFVAFILFFIIFTGPKTTIRLIASRQFTHLKSFLRGAFWNVYGSKQSLIF
jgi:GT2 family glycosyltransferase